MPAAPDVKSGSVRPPPEAAEAAGNPRVQESVPQESVQQESVHHDSVQHDAAHIAHTAHDASPTTHDNAAHNAPPTSLHDTHGALQPVTHLEPDSGSDTDSAYDGTSSASTSLASSILNYEYSNGRRYHGFRSGAYVLPNDEQEQDRLDLLHHIFTLILGGRLYDAPIDPRRAASSTSAPAPASGPSTWPTRTPAATSWAPTSAPSSPPGSRPTPSSTLTTPRAIGSTAPTRPLTSSTCAPCPAPLPTGTA